MYVYIYIYIYIYKCIYIYIHRLLKKLLRKGICKKLAFTNYVCSQLAEGSKINSSSSYLP